MIPNWWRQYVDRREFLGVSGLVLGGLGSAAGAEPALLPTGVKAVWDLEKAHREKTATRERVCLNGLWRWQPARETADAEELAAIHISPPLGDHKYFLESREVSFLRIAAAALVLPAPADH